MSNKLMEAAADILSGSKGKAPAMPPAKLPGTEVVDLGGPTPQNGKPTDDSEKIDATKAAKSATAPTTKPSAASPALPSTNLKKEDVEQDMDAIFEDGTISEDFKEKAATIFEARVLDRVNQLEEEIETRYAGMLEEAVQQIQEDLSQKVDDYLSYVVEQWIEQNEVAIESGLRNELSEDFINGLKNLFVEHYIDVPEDKVDLVDELSGKVVDLETKLDEEINRGIEYRKALIESKKSEVVHTVCEGLTDTQVEKIKTLAESVEFSTEDEYRGKLDTIRNSYFPISVKKADESQLHETVENDGTKPVVTDAFVAAVSQAISKSSTKF
ncbi:hypothetical protein M0R04_05335 [Candidatus Dojkabacteria bacterium]|jgi:hypothetical protein|nr:hypothetical protein [Candidatus Dojkabacteria bacterium]